MNQTNNIIISNTNNYNKDINNIIFNLSDFMLTNSLLNNRELFFILNTENTLNSSINNSINSNLNSSLNSNLNSYVPKNVNKNVNNNYFISFKSKTEDSLFWCFYKIYQLQNNNNYIENNINNKFLTEKNFKISSINNIKNNSILKKYKMSKATIENDLLNEKKISYDTFNILCNVYCLNIFYVKNRIYSKINKELDISYDCENEEKEDNVKIYILYDNEKEIKITLNNQYNSENYKHMIKNLIEVDNINKPLKNISYYKLKDLQDFSNKLNISISNDTKKKTKKELYDNINNILNEKIE